MKAFIIGFAALSAAVLVSPASTVAAPLLPVTATGYTHDIIFGGGETGAGINGCMDFGGGFVGGATWYGVGRNAAAPTTGLPVGLTASQSTPTDLSFQLQPFAGASNAMMLNGGETKTLTITSPSVYTRIALLGAVGNRGASDSLSVTITHANATVETFGGSSVSQDWFNGSSVAFNAQGRSTNLDGTTFDNVNNNNPRLYQTIFTLANTTSPVTSISATYTGTGHEAIMAVSGEVPEPHAIMLAAGIGGWFTLSRRRKSASRPV